MRAFHLLAKPATGAHSDGNGCTADRRCEVWTDSDEARARALAHTKFWQEATPVNPDSTSPWTDPEMVDCAEVSGVQDGPVPAAEAVFAWDDRLIARETADGPRKTEKPASEPDPSKKLNQH